ncbi:M55 family metallopeptidase [Amycolatopsis taiwanensis]|uniref:M55 family metallopeptidase n=1 Tax=Amycolatopsis taiwanensis TaxID=342230 RepID=UPI0004833073|nr:M55 family metallopeptidase [Amycolatopsis taiwanensis]
MAGLADDADAVLFVGDDTIVTEAAEVAPGMRCVVVKTALGARSAALLHPDEARDRIQQAVPDALANRESVRSLRFDARIRIAAAIWHNEHNGQPVMRSLTAYDH